MRAPVFAIPMPTGNEAMPGISELEQLSKNYGLAIGLLIVAVIFLSYVIMRLYRDNQQLWTRITSILDERGKTLESILENSYGRPHS